MPKLPEPVINVSPTFTPQRPISASDLYRGGSALPEALQQASRTLQQGADVLAEKQQRDAAFQVNRDMAKVRNDWVQHLAKRKEEAEPGAPAFTSNLIEEYDAAMDDMLANSSLPAGARQDLRLKQADFKQYLVGQSIAFESQSRGNQHKREVEATIDNMSQVVGADPSTLGANVADLDELIGALDTDADTRENLRTYGRKTLALAAAQASVLANPYQARDVLKGTTPEGDYYGILRAAESGGDDAATPGTSSAFGRYQFTAPTWEHLQRKYPGLGLTADGRADPEQQERAIKVFTAENRQALVDAGFDPNPKNLYMAHFLGAAGAVRFLAGMGANSNAPATSFVDSAAVDANKAVFFDGGKPRTLAEVFDRQTAKFPAALPTNAAGKTGNPAYDALPFVDRQRLLSAAETKITDLQAVARAELAPRVADAQQAYLTNGEYTGAPIRRSDFLAAYGPEQGELEYQAFLKVQQTGQQVTRLKTMTAAEIMATVKAEKPANSGPGFAAEQSQFEILQQAADSIIKQRNDDPVGYVQTVFPEVGKAWDSAFDATGKIVDPAAVSGAMQATLSAQERIGVPKDQQVLLPKTVADTAIQSFDNAEASFDDRVTAVSNLVFATPDRAQRQKVLSQLVSAGMPGKFELAFEALARGDEAAADRLFRAGMVKPGDLPGKITETSDQIANAIQTRIMEAGQIGDAVYGISAGVIGNEERAARDAALMVDAVKYRLAGGASLNDAIDATARDLYGPVKVYQGDGATIVLPDDADERTVSLGLQIIRDNFRIPLEAFKTEPEPGASPQDLQHHRMAMMDVQRYIDSIIDDGEIRNVNGGFGLLDPGTGMFVAGSDGKPFTFSLEQIVGAGKAAMDSPGAWPADLPRPEITERLEFEGVEP